MANITSLNLGLFERTSAGGALSTSRQPFVPAASKRKISHTRIMTDAATAFVAPYYSFNANSGAVIDVTVRLYMPQMEKAADASAPIATSTGAATRTQDASAADNSGFEWVVSV